MNNKYTAKNVCGNYYIVNWYSGTEGLLGRDPMPSVSIPESYNVHVSNLLKYVYNLSSVAWARININFWLLAT
jgi:hypothetical protein